MKHLLNLEPGDVVESDYVVNKHISPDAIYFDGHYPGNPIFPGVLQLELAIKVATDFLSSLGETSVHLSQIVKFRFYKSVRPGDNLIIKVKSLSKSEYGTTFEAQLFTKDNLTSGGIFLLGNTENYNESHTRFKHDSDTHSTTCLDIDDIKGILPHRFPFLQVDKVISMEPEESIVGLKNVSSSDYMFWGRDTDTIFPRSIIIEALLQCAGILGLKFMNGSGVPLIGFIGNAIFTENAYPGDQLLLKASVVRIFSNSGIMSGSIQKNGRSICDVENLIFTLNETTSE
jgi:3-hydroxyacyl-[acyl-carrier-protein] dehydratase